MEASLQQVEKAKQQARAVTTKYAEIIDHPADMEILYQLNVRTVLSFDVARQWLREIVSFHEGKPYWRHAF